MGKGAFAASLIAGIPLIFFGLAFISYGLFGVSMLIGPEVMMVGIMIFAGGVICIWAGKRTMRPKVSRLTADEWRRMNQ